MVSGPEAGRELVGSCTGHHLELPSSRYIMIRSSGRPGSGRYAARAPDGIGLPGSLEHDGITVLMRIASVSWFHPSFPTAARR
jgi:hypothetical protein